ncbi:glycosyltransferase [Limosilactobacillus reuteri]|uniref:glycosyltransferase n=1 Tax=Limosilactobacillus reuteri TaxID=1598 RepID=UPI001E65CB7E|nr:glycosyltransferase [Limosilactobacillus reuteri]MCC4396622.1 glycosyltransferase [Limosilactobacillus reuteri]
MIFVTVGTHEQPFDRLIKELDTLIEKKVITETVIAQIGYCNYKPKNIEWYKFLSYQEMHNFTKEARVVITHGGPASFILPLQYNKIPIVVPRKAEFNEHINNHQVEFVKLIERKLNNLIPIYDVEDLGEKIRNYNKLTNLMSERSFSNNKNFNKQFKNVIDDLFKGVSK